MLLRFARAVVANSSYLQQAPALLQMLPIHFKLTRKCQPPNPTALTIVAVWPTRLALQRALPIMRTTAGGSVKIYQIENGRTGAGTSSCGS